MSQGSTEPVVGFDLHAFRRGADAFIFAARRDDPTAPLVYLEQGSARECKAFAKANLICPEPGCTTPALTTVSRSQGGRRDGYRHLRRPLDRTHAPESVMHRQGKALVARWASSHPRVAVVEVERPVGNRTADVLLTGHHGGRIAVEIQYSALSVDEHEQRTEDYLTQGVQPVWLWGHVGHHSPVYRLRDVHASVVRRDWPLLWVNPAEEKVAWLVGGDGCLFDPERQTFAYRFGTFNDLAVRSIGLTPPGWDQLLAATAAKRALEEQRAREAAEREAARCAARTKRWYALTRGNKEERDRVYARLGLQADQREPSLLPAPSPRRPGEVHYCRKCGLSLDPILWACGEHADPDCDKA